MSLKDSKKAIIDSINEAEKIMKSPVLKLPDIPIKNDMLQDIDRVVANFKRHAEKIPDT
jgi:hypothetical protein